MKYWLSHLPLEVWVDCYRYPWKSRNELGEIVDRFGNRKFAEYLQFYLHDWGKQKLHLLFFDQNQNAYGVHVCVPLDSSSKICYYTDFPLAPMPENINTFEHISISHFDTRPIDFLLQIRPILSDVNLGISGILPENFDNLRTILANLLPLLNGIHSLSSNVPALPAVQQCFGNERLAAIKLLAIKQRGGMGMDETGRQAAVNFLMSWLTPQQQEDCGPKWCEVGINMYNDPNNGFCEQFSTAIRQEFLAAKSPSTFAVSLRPGYTRWQFVEFHLQNSIGEELHGVQIGQLYNHQIQITRHRANCGTELEEWVKENTKEMNGDRQISIHSPTVGLDPVKNTIPKDGEEVQQKPSTSKGEQPSCSCSVM